MIICHLYDRQSARMRSIQFLRCWTCTRVAAALMQFVLNLRQQQRPRCMHALYSPILITGFKPICYKILGKLNPDICIMDMYRCGVEWAWMIRNKQQLATKTRKCASNFLLIMLKKICFNLWQWKCKLNGCKVCVYFEVEVHKAPISNNRK